MVRLCLNRRLLFVNGMVFVGSEDGYLYAIDATRGILLEIPNGRTHPFLACSFDGAVYFTSEEPNTGALYKLDAANGAQLWKKVSPTSTSLQEATEMLGSPSVADGTVFASV